ncbi:ATP-binding cassette domain-containing protein [Actinobacteria bacterium YIM 96077]|uniref:ABC transporter n=1 Tax=Phytoactinopolyspora halophila TaxID=1981511 RepID=A0A329QZ52_9ACTN|nr:branched-chain amino acid ABC transporter ATP-binding protein/permease [Phytoactinopolyspora halophila]AYY13154.1 ATP-binding cassette domain-containing protein [Actinobacteria bacterium YIM 96077]RAW17605.1 ABC transporter [Phytoactinopolyspora halophila]
MFAGYESLITTMALTGILAFSFHVVLMAGQLSLGQAGFASLGAYISTLVVPETPLFGGLSPVLVGIPVGMAVGATAAFVLGLPVMRLRGVFLAIATIAFAEVVRILMLNAEWTNGARGLRLERWVTPELAWFVLAILVYAFWRLGPSRIGRAFAAVREDEVAASSMGVDVARTRMTSFVASGAIAGLYGVLFAYFVRRIGPSDFGFSMMLDGLVVAVVGGFLVFFGPLLGSAFITMVPEVQRAAGLEAGWIHPFVTGALLLVVILLLPGGLSSIAGYLHGRLRRSPPPAPSTGPRAGNEPPELPELPAADTPVLTLNGVGKDYGGVHAVHDVDLELRAGEILGVIGPNGAGKTTLVNMISGHVAPTSGDGHVLGRKLGAAGGAHRVARAGVSRTFQHSKLFDRLSVLENTLVGTHLVSKPTFVRRLLWLPSARRDENRAVSQARRQVQRVGLADREHVPAAQLSYGDQRRLEIARALASHPSLLILDEPAAGMNRVEAAELSELIRSLAADGVTIMLIEHNVHMVLDTCTRVVVLNFGEVIASGPPQVVASDPQVIEAYLGSDETGREHV